MVVFLEAIFVFLPNRMFVRSNKFCLPNPGLQFSFQETSRLKYDMPAISHTITPITMFTISCATLVINVSGCEMFLYHFLPRHFCKM